LKIVFASGFEPDFRRNREGQGVVAAAIGEVTSCPGDAQKGPFGQTLEITTIEGSISGDNNHAGTLFAQKRAGFFSRGAEASEEAILNSLFKARTMTGFKGRKVEALPLDKLKELMIKVLEEMREGKGEIK